MTPGHTIWVSLFSGAAVGAMLALAVWEREPPPRPAMHLNANPSCFAPGTPGAETFGMCPDRIRLGYRNT